MASMLSDALTYFANTTVTELFAVITALAYVIFAARGSLWCWPAAMISTVLYTVIFYDYYLWSDSALQIYYFAMAIYGWYNWHKNKQQKSNISHNLANVENNTIEIISHSKRYHCYAIAILSIISLGLGYVMANYTPTDFPYLDATTTVFALFATYLVTKRVLENWLYWVVTDLASIYLYHAKALNPTAVLFILYVILASVAYVSWRKTYQAQTA